MFILTEDLGGHLSKAIFITIIKSSPKIIEAFDNLNNHWDICFSIALSRAQYSIALSMGPILFQSIGPIHINYNNR